MSSKSTFERIALLTALAPLGCGRLLYEPRFDAGPVDVGLTADARLLDAPTPCAFDPGAVGVGACPSACTGGCAGGVCTVACDASSACAADDIVCPAAWPCVVSCGGSMSCAATMVDASDASSLDMRCRGSESCVADTITCPTTGSCNLACTGAVTCTSSTLACGEGGCAASCGSAAAFMHECGMSRCCAQACGG
jgi:hypothetical protein